MKGAYVCSDRGVPAFGSKGCSLHIQEVVRAMKGHGHELSLFAAATGDNCPKDLSSIEFHRVKHSKINDRHLREQSDIRDNEQTIHQLTKYAPYEFIYERYSLWSHAGMSYGYKHNLPTILEVNAPLIEEQKKYRSLYDEHSAYYISQLCFDHAQTIIAVSQQVADYLQGFSETRGKVHVLPNGVNTDKFQCASGKHTPNGGTTIGFVGTLKPWHGVDHLLEAFALLLNMHPKCHLLIVGDGPERQNLEQLAHQLNIAQSVTFTGAVAPDCIPDYYQRMDIAVAPYPEQSSFYFSPLKIYEYMAAGLPTVSSNMGQIGQILSHGETGLLYDAQHPETLVFSLSYLVHNPSIGQRLGKNARLEAESKHSWTLRVKDILSLAGVSKVA
tara:strand:+ start:1016 stop:2173 length:1158 start_codon:yes stop_codon:yes gene_type:complete